MYIIDITVSDAVPVDQRDTLFAEHARWFKKHFDAGRFVMLGPYTDTTAAAGVILAHVSSREALQRILEEDCYFPELATYQIREFTPKMIADDIGKILSNG